MRWIGLALLSLAFASTARAQTTAALMPATGGDEVGPAAVAAVRAAAIEHLRGARYLVLEDVRVQSFLDEEQRACLPGDPCTAAVYARVGVDVLVGLELSGTEDALTEVRVLLVRGPEAAHEGSAPADGDPAAAVAAALGAAMEAADRQRGPFLHVVGTPEARVSVDGEEVGVIPLTVRTTPGAHTVSAQLGTLPPREAAVTIPDDEAHTEELELRLEAGPAESDDAPEGELAWAVVVGAGTIAAGLALAALPPAISYLSAGCTNGSCTEFEEVDDAVWAWVAVGGVVAAAGVVLVIVGATSEPAEATVQARVGPGRISLEGTF